MALSATSLPRPVRLKSPSSYVVLVGKYRAKTTANGMFKPSFSLGHNVDAGRGSPSLPFSLLCLNERFGTLPGRVVGCCNLKFFN